MVELIPIPGWPTYITRPCRNNKLNSITTANVFAHMDSLRPDRWAQELIWCCSIALASRHMGSYHWPPVSSLGKCQAGIKRFICLVDLMKAPKSWLPVLTYRRMLMHLCFLTVEWEPPSNSYRWTRDASSSIGGLRKKPQEGRVRNSGDHQPSIGTECPSQ